MLWEVVCPSTCEGMEEPVPLAPKSLVDFGCDVQLDGRAKKEKEEEERFVSSQL